MAGHLRGLATSTWCSARCLEDAARRAEVTDGPAEDVDCVASLPCGPTLDASLQGIFEGMRSLEEQHRLRHEQVALMLGDLAREVTGMSISQRDFSARWVAKVTEPQQVDEPQQVKSGRRVSYKKVEDPPLQQPTAAARQLNLPAGVEEVANPAEPASDGARTPTKAVTSVRMVSPGSDRSSSAVTSASSMGVAFSLLDEDETEEVHIPRAQDGLYPFISALCRKVIRWQHFDRVIGVVILLNSASIGWEAAESVNGREVGVINSLELIFLLIYIMELLARFLADGVWMNLARPWVRFDVFLVGLGTVSMAIIEPIKQSLEGDGVGAQSSATDALETIMIFRIMRLLRLLRALRMVSQFKTLWRLVQGLLNSLDTMLSTLALLFFMIYIFACIGIEFITKDQDLKEHADPDIRSILANNFGTMPGIMLTLTQFVTLDSIAGIYGPLVMDKWWRILYFLPIILIVPVALMNLVTAVLVEAAMAMGKDDEELQKKLRRAKLKELTPAIRTAFEMVDADGSGILTGEEVVNAANNLPGEFMETMKGGDVLEFFESLDIDGSGEITESEFVDGVLHYLMSDVPIETQQTMKLLRLIKEKLQRLEDTVFELPGAPRRSAAHLAFRSPSALSNPHLQAQPAGLEREQRPEAKHNDDDIVARRAAISL